MKKKFIAVAFMASAIVIVFTSIVKSNSAGATWGVCGAPHDQATPIGIACGYSGCHNFQPILNDPSLTITLIDPGTNQPVNAYKENVKYTVKIELRRASIVDCGFESTIETASGDNFVGTFAPKIKSQITPGNSNYVTHSTYIRTSPGYGMWEYYWTSPKTSQGDITIYAACNDGNGSDNQNGTGDSIFTATKTYSHSAGVNNAYISEDNVFLFPNPARSNFTVNYNLISGASAVIDMYDLNGVLVKTVSSGMMPQGENKTNMNIADLNPGIYFVRIVAGTESVTKKIMIGN